jgi:ubiquinone/menaquinone biosynthesis C-methylase UbiE
VTELSSARVAQAWTTFWATQSPGSRCLACAPAQIVEPLDSHWRKFAPILPEGTTVIDLGCGAGAVAIELLAAQPHLELTGIDIAIVPQPADSRIMLLPCTPMELLPFADASFGAAVSQFGYEYGRRVEAAHETARVLAAGAPLSFLVHHSDSPIVRGMELHKRAIEGLCGWPMRSAFLGGDRGALEEEIARVSCECRGDPIVYTAARALRAHLAQDKRRRTALWNAIMEALEPERVMLTALDHCCIGHGDVEHWTGPLSEDFDLAAPEVLRARMGEPIAWAIAGIRRA